jgi:hypothetical protein
MAIYTLHLPNDVVPGTGQVADKLRVVKDGFSWTAFIFPLPWLLINRLWLWSVVFFAASFLLGYVAQTLGASQGILFLSILLLALFIGLEAGALKAGGLKKRGFSQVASFVAADAEEAELKFFSTWRAA